MIEIYNFGIIHTKERKDRLYEYLRKGLYDYISYINLESAIVINVNKDELSHLANKFGQSVIFGENYLDYIKLQHWENGVELTSAYSCDKNFTYSGIHVFDDINKLIECTYRDLKDGTINKINELNNRIVCEEKTLKHYYQLRGNIRFLLKEQPIKLVNRDEEKFKNARRFHTGYWVKCNNIYEVDTSHVRFVLDNPELFGFTKEKLIKIYRRHGEKIGFEGKARKEIIIECARKGWVRVRFYRTPDIYWTIQFNNRRKREECVKRFIYYAMDYLGMDLNDSVSLLDYGYSINR